MLILPDGALKPAGVVKNLGIYLDETLSMDDNARHCTGTCFFHMRRIRQLGRYIDYETKYTLVQSPSSYYGWITVTVCICRLINDNTIRRLQSANCSCQAVVWCIIAYPCSSSFESVTLATRRQSYSVQTVLFVVRHLPRHCTGDMSEPCKPCTDNRLRSAAHGNFVVHRTRLRLAVCRSKAWNGLPLSIRNIISKETFARQLKTHLINILINCNSC